MHTIHSVVPRLTLDDVATRAGVSRMTVSNAYARPEVVAPATRERVLTAARELGYTGPNPAGRSLRRGRSGVVGVVVGDSLPYLFSDPGAATVMQGMASEAAAHDLALQIIHGVGPSAVDRVQSAIVDAWVVYGVDGDQPALRAVVDRGQPLVTVSGPRVPGHPGIAVDARAAGAALAEHLLELGHRSVAVVTPSVDAPNWTGRLAGYHDAFERAGVTDVRVHLCDENTRDAGRRAGESLVEALTTSGPSAVIAVTDVLALGILDVTRARGVRVPDDLSLVGFDDIDEAASSSPPLTTVHQRLEGQGRLAVQLAIGAARRRPLARVLPAHLVVRASTSRAEGQAARRSSTFGKSTGTASEMFT